MKALLVFPRAVDGRAHPRPGPIAAHYLTESSCGMKTMKGDGLSYRRQDGKHQEGRNIGSGMAVTHYLTNPFRMRNFGNYLCSKFIIEP